MRVALFEINIPPAPEVPASPVTGPTPIDYLRAILGDRTDSDSVVVEFLEDTPESQEQGFTIWASKKALNILGGENGKA